MGAVRRNAKGKAENDQADGLHPLPRELGFGRVQLVWAALNFAKTAGKAVETRIFPSDAVLVKTFASPKPS